MHAVDLSDERRVDAVAEHAADVLDTARTVSRVIDKVNASCGRSHGSQYCAVSARRAFADRLAPPPCHNVPRKNTHDPALITTGCAFGRLR